MFLKWNKQKKRATTTIQQKTINRGAHAIVHLCILCLDNDSSICCQKNKTISTRFSHTFNVNEDAARSFSLSPFQSFSCRHCVFCYLSVNSQSVVWIFPLGIDWHEWEETHTQKNVFNYFCLFSLFRERFLNQKILHTLIVGVAGAGAAAKNVEKQKQMITVKLVCVIIPTVTSTDTHTSMRFIHSVAGMNGKTCRLRLCVSVCLLYL